MYAVKKAQLQGDFQQAVNSIPYRSTTNGSYNLGLLEKARLEYLAMKNKQSREYFAETYKLIQQNQQGAKIELSRGFENLSAFVSNDNAIRYDVPLYEQSMLHSYQTLNYLSQNDLSGALVEVRRANQVQETALKNNANASKPNSVVNSTNLPKKYPSMSHVIGSVKNGFQNAYTFYLSALLYEAVGQKNDAYIDYKKALDIYPDNSYLQQDIWRLATTLQMTNDISFFKQHFPSKITKKIAAYNQGQVIIIVENGIISAKQEASLSLPIYTSHNEMRLYSVALPIYPNQLTTYPPLIVSYQGKTYQAEEIVRLQSLAAKQLKDELPAIITRQITRLIAKEKIRETLMRKGNDIGNIFANIYNLASEKADTRSWSTLPDSIDILRLGLPEGVHMLDLKVNGIHQQIEVSINPNKQTLVTLSAIDTHVSYKTTNL
jgi:hypothetical protein